MGWKRLKISDDDLAIARLEYGKKAAFLLDENLEHDTRDLLRSLGWNVLGVSEVGLVGRDDKEVFAYAWSQKRMLLTKDRDFLDDRAFPEHCNPGVIVVPDVQFESEDFVKVMRTVVHVIGPMRMAYMKAKIQISATGNITIRARDNETGAMRTNRYSLGMHDQVYIWEDE